MVNSATSPSVRNRDGIYTQLDNIPTSAAVALRDVSNHWSPSCELNHAEGDAARPRRKVAARHKKKTPRRPDCRKRVDAPPEPNVPPPPLPDAVELSTTDAQNILESCQK